MNYSNIQPPFTLMFKEMSKQELQDYYKWYLDIIPERIGALTTAVWLTPGYEDWKPDFSPDSLNRLGQWYAAHVEVRSRTQEELDAIQALSPLPIEVPPNELTIRTFSLAMDIGMYMSQVFLHQFPDLHWTQDLKKKKYVDYGQPVLAPFDKLEFNPTRMLVVQAYGLVDGTWDGASLRRLYDVWSAKLTNGVDGRA